jgi:hypothetical protein
MQAVGQPDASVDASQNQHDAVIDGGGPDAVEPDAQIAPTLDAGFDAGLDPDVKFEWVETLPGQGMCGPGHYAGSFTCTITSDMPLRDGSQLAGPITFDLVSGATESALTIAEGRLSDPLGFAFSAELEGILDCVERKLHAGTVGHLETDPLLPSMFEAELEGDFDDQSLVISGDFEMRNADGDVCPGVFEASAIP